MSYRGAIAALRQYSFRRRLLGWKLAPSVAVALIPTLIAFTFALVGEESVNAPEPYRFYGHYLAPLCLLIVTLGVSLLTMLPVLGELYERGSVGYLVTRPVPRWVHLAGLYQGGLLALLPLTLLAAVLPALILASFSVVEVGFWLRDVLLLAGLLWLGGAVYGALWMLLGAAFRKPIIPAIVIVLFELSGGNLPGALRTVSIQRYLSLLLRDWLEVENDLEGALLFPDLHPPGPTSSLVILIVTGAGLFFLASRAIRRRDVL